MGPTVASRALPHCWISPPSNQAYPCLGLDPATPGLCLSRALSTTLPWVLSIYLTQKPASACITIGLPGVLVKGQKRWPCLAWPQLPRQGVLPEVLRSRGLSCSLLSADSWRKDQGGRGLTPRTPGQQDRVQGGTGSGYVLAGRQCKAPALGGTRGPEPSQGSPQRAC